MDPRITQCPRCGTSFRVTEAHLAVAAGAVRCGSCLHIFNARDHWVETESAAPAEPEKPLAARQVEAIDIDDDALIDDDSPFFDEEDEPTPTKTGSGSIFNPIDDDFEVIDDSGTEEFSETFLDINSWEEDSSHSFSHEIGGDDDIEEGASSELEWTQKLLEEEDETGTATAPDVPARSEVFDDYDSLLDSVPAIDDADTDTDEETSGSADFSSEFLDLEADAIAAAPRDPTAAPGRLGAASAGDDFTLALETDDGDAHERPLFALRDIDQEPLQLDQFVKKSRWPALLWPLALVATLAFSAWQYLYFHFDELAHGASRPWLAQACSVLGCTLPAQLDLAAIRTNSLIVRSHPTRPGALAVDAVITNQADFAQPYPTLQLQFSDLNGAPVAGRRFQPGEYLSGELTGSRLMPVRQPVHIALEIIDPGPRAVNYQLSVVAPGSAP